MDGKSYTGNGGGKENAHHFRHAVYIVSSARARARASRVYRNICPARGKPLYVRSRVRNRLTFSARFFTFLLLSLQHLQSNGYYCITRDENDIYLFYIFYIFYKIDRGVIVRSREDREPVFFLNARFLVDSYAEWRNDNSRCYIQFSKRRIEWKQYFRLAISDKASEDSR